MIKPTNDPIINDVLKLHIKRHKQGMKQFKKTITKNTKPMLEWIKDAREEAMDFVVYLTKIEKELKKIKTKKKV
tara:strand:- start:136 stop:357 length:222 start_codon:yes stop_codon:yes gene_type:complete